MRYRREAPVNGLALYPKGFPYISVYSGGGGLDVGVHQAIQGARCVCYVEVEAPAVACLVAGMEAGVLDEAPVFSDARAFGGRRFRGRVRGVVGGSPCPEFSLANPERKDTPEERLATERGSLFFRLFAIADECGAEVVIWENVGGAASALPLCFEWLADRGWRGAWCRVRASDVGATHERARVFVLAYRDGAALGQQPGRGRRASGAGTALSGFARAAGDAGAVADGASLGRGEGRPESAGLGRGPDASECGGAVGDDCQDLADSNGIRRQGEWLHERRRHMAPGLEAGDGGGLPLWPPGPADVDGWRAVLERAPHLVPALPQPAICRVVDGLEMVAGGVDRIEALRLLGNGVVPEQAAYAIRGLFSHLLRGGG